MQAGTDVQVIEGGRQCAMAREGKT